MLFEFEFWPRIIGGIRGPPLSTSFDTGCFTRGFKPHLISHCTVALIARTVAAFGPFLRSFLWGCLRGISGGFSAEREP